MLAYRAMTQDIKTVNYDGQIASSSANTSVSPQTVSDSITSLRALALSTLRPKRRRDDISSRPPLPASLPSRPPPPNDASVFLDYGSDSKEDRTESSHAVPPSADDSTSNNKATNGQAACDQDAKEEGEISDEETQAPSIASSNGPLNSAKEYQDAKRGFSHQIGRAHV